MNVRIVRNEKKAEKQVTCIQDVPVGRMWLYQCDEIGLRLSQTHYVNLGGPDTTCAPSLYEIAGHGHIPVREILPKDATLTVSWTART